jgi:hypothetical protein
VEEGRNVEVQRSGVRPCFGSPEKGITPITVSPASVVVEEVRWSGVPCYTSGGGLGRRPRSAALIFGLRLEGRASVCAGTTEKGGDMGASLYRGAGGAVRGRGGDTLQMYL